ncbi:MAG: hypothetical protein NVS3B28_22220 [Candidatus Velthaea sp.]
MLTSLPLVTTIVFLAAVGSLQLRTYQEAQRTQHSDAVLAQSQRLLGAVVDAQTAIRGYAATGKAAFAAPFDQAEVIVPALAAGLVSLTREGSERRNGAAEIAAAAAHQLQRFRAIDEALRGGRRSEAIATLVAVDGERSMDDFRNQIASFELKESLLKANRDAKLQRSWGFLSILLALGTIVSIAVTLLLNVAFARAFTNRLRDLAVRAERFGHGEPFESAAGSDDEVGVLEAAFARMAADLSARQEALSRYQMLATTTSDIIIFSELPTLKIIEANRAAIETYGYSYDELLKLRIHELRAPETLPILADLVAGTANTVGIRFETLHITKNGRVFPVEVSARAATIQGRETIVSTVRDITERQHAAEEVVRALDQALQASRMKTEFVATMSHEIRTPMNGVIGMSELLARSDLTEPQRELATTVRDSAHALLTIIDDILDFSKLEAGRIKIEALPLDVREVVDGVAALVRSSVNEKGLVLNIEVSPRLPDRLSGDPTRLRQILINLAGNAIKFTDAGSVTIGVRIEAEDETSMTVGFRVTDTGIGIAPETARDLFEPFVQADGTTSRKYGGTGLGLSISRRLVELMGGRIGVVSDPGAGAEFWFTARFLRAAEAIVPRAIGRLEGRVLLVEDDIVASTVCERYLRSWGLDVTPVANADEALTKLRAARREGERYSLALIDYILPRGDGIALARRIRGEFCDAIPKLIMVTAFDSDVRKEEALNAGFADYLLKPVGPSHLYDAIERVLDRPKATEPAKPGAVPVLARAGPARILLAEDQAINRRVAALQLEQLGQMVTTLDNGRQAIDAVAGGSFDLVLMDCQMPEVDGFAATRAIREAERSSGRHITIVALTANVLERDRRACIAAGMDDYLTKPLEIEQLRAMLDRWLPAAEIENVT